MSRYSTEISRRTYLRVTGASSVAGLSGVAGCIGGGGGADEIVPGTAPGFPPFEMKDDQGTLVGFDVDLLTAVVEEADGYTLGEWKEFEFSSLIPALTNDRIDVIAAAMTITEDRDATIDFSDPYYSADQAILVRKGGDFSPGALDDLSGHLIGAQEGTTGAGVVKDELVKPGKLKESNFKTYGNYVLAVEDLENGNLDAIVVDKPVAQTFVESRDVEIAFIYETGENYGFGVRTEDDDLTSALNEGLGAVRDAGRYEELRNKWFAES
ncbi:MAG: basic amino acid ABC transporter substrate-binding protein [Haloferacaceae archaeon]